MGAVEQKIAKDLEILRRLVRRLPDIEGVEVTMRDGFVMMSPVRPVHSSTVWKLSAQIDAQVPADADLAVDGDVEFAWPTWNRDCAPDVVLWEGEASRSNTTLGPADLIELACEVVSPTSVENDYVDKVAAYAAVPIPAYLILDPYTGTAVVHSRPERGSYRRREVYAYGEPIKIELSFGTITVETGGLPLAPEDERREEWPGLLD